ncbi:nitric oxide synthase oxygenase, partial [Staphylococcus aureus]|uniref:nitric oxide synthase oxygenase n=1 Tax=Staphylococcus aureus TaxID=1280 RepID=UPI00210BDEA7
WSCLAPPLSPTLTSNYHHGYDNTVKDPNFFYKKKESNANQCPSGAMYKRDEDGIVLVDQDACRGWRYCMKGCPYKKVYFNWKTNKAEKCTFCFPRLEAGMPTVCSETCTGRMRYLGVLLYDADRVHEAASAV